MVSACFTTNLFGVTINVALGNRDTYSMSGILSNDPTQSLDTGTAAPLTYTGSTWNQPGTSVNNVLGLLDSDGTLTSVGFSLSGYQDTGIGDHGGEGIMNFLGAGVHSDGPSTIGGFNPEPSTLPTLTITGLNDNYTYSVAIISGGNYNHTNQWNFGGTADFSDPNLPGDFTGGTTLTTVSSTETLNVWVNGVNYVVFSNIQSTGGNIVIQNRAINDKFSMNGFQLVAIPEPSHAALFALGVFGFLFHRRRL
ncbi:MAG: PEP-CTERM sorting domain-containing protein [Verrucomicrobiota bacterium]